MPHHVIEQVDGCGGDPLGLGVWKVLYWWGGVGVVCLSGWPACSAQSAPIVGPLDGMPV
jgi:hypothetical protein